MSLTELLDQQLTSLRNDDLVSKNASGGALRNNQFYRLFWAQPSRPSPTRPKRRASIRRPRRMTCATRTSGG
ncbi:hypothetical protein [Arthrobacter bussei]|uniref:Uncharacterized protein n=1 Tax=Arthrobacter bussei TaxID=2594179 RepID=A0A7X1TNL9_9MICC|nr:hypothetical protein [Arthrobacter bussei]MPY10884.1 hypothetical protein [Arthrobacter bussei]